MVNFKVSRRAVAPASQPRVGRTFTRDEVKAGSHRCHTPTRFICAN